MVDMYFFSSFTHVIQGVSKGIMPTLPGRDVVSQYSILTFHTTADEPSGPFPDLQSSFLSQIKVVFITDLQSTFYHRLAGKYNGKYTRGRGAKHNIT